MLTAFLLNLGHRDKVSEAETELLRKAFSRARTFPVGQDMVAAGDRPTQSSVIIEGFAARYKDLPNGRRQITAIHVPGDFIDLHGFLLKTMDQGVVALTPCKVAFADHDEVRRITEMSPHLTRLLWLDTLVHGAIHREWIVAMGRRSKKSHLAHLICELFVRLRAVDRAGDYSFQLPFTQAELADVLGLSTVHVNRTLQALRRDQLVAWTGQNIEIKDWTRLQEVAEFDPIYLSLQFEPR